MNENQTEMSGSVSELAKSLSQVQEKLASIQKDESGYGYNYASLASTVATLKTALKGSGLSISQLVLSSDKDSASIMNVLLHESGQFLKFTTKIPLPELKKGNVTQQVGAAISYARRYSLQALFNMASEDNDANIGNKNNDKETSSTNKLPSYREQSSTVNSGDL